MVTAVGHATFLIQMDGLNILTDPVWSDRCSPVSWAGPRRYRAPGIPFEALPPIDALLISHNHYDHLDRVAVEALEPRSPRYVVPLGVGALLREWGVDSTRIEELDWWDSTRVGDLEIVATPARHASGRSFPPGGNPTLWAGFALVGREHRAWYSGDTGLFPGLREIGERLGPFDVTMVEAGAYGRHWPDWHLGPEQAVVAHQWARGRAMIPAHWGLFNLAFHGWTEPVDRVLVAAEKAGVTVLVPKPGESLEPASSPALVRWWPALDGNTAEQDPIVSSKLDGAGRL